ncbi:MAG TPA: radical SAM protein [Terriglobales bacterium]|nr:radical SAM protein [Terriglobales bacterium]
MLLTHSYHLLYDRKQVRKMQPYPPLGTLFAASVLRQKGLSVALFDTMLRDPVSEFPDVLGACRPKIVAIYEDDFNFLTKMCLSRMRELAWQMAALAREAGAVVVCHGSDATDHAADYLQHSVDYVLFGESEYALADLCRKLSRGTAGAIPGVVQAESSILSTRVSHNVGDFTALPSPAWDLVDIKSYREAWRTAHGYFSLNLVSSRGCPYRCNWCAKPISGDKFRLRAPATVADEMLRLKRDCSAEHFWFADDVFALSHTWTTEFANEVQSRECQVAFKIQSRADLMSERTVADLKRAGCSEVWMGVESGSQKVLDAMDKGLHVQQIIDARNRLKSADIRACYFLQFGYPGEEWEDIQKTISLVRSTRPDDIGVSLSYPLPNTGFYNRVRDELGHKRNWRDSDDLCVIFKGAYTDSFYRAIRDALHAEVESWTAGVTTGLSVSDIWKSVESMEPFSRNSDATLAHSSARSSIVPLAQLAFNGKGA